MSRRATRPSWLLAGLVFTACVDRGPLELIVAPREIPTELAHELEGLAVDGDDPAIATQVGTSEHGNLDAVADGTADLAIVPNNIGFRDDVRTVAVLYTGVLHALHRRAGEPANLAELIEGARVYAGPEGSVERWMLAALADRAQLDAATYTLVDEIDQAEVAMLFAPILGSVPEPFTSGWQLFSFGDVNELGRGAAVEGIALGYPSLRPFVIPARSYSVLGHGPIVTLAVDVVLVARADLDDQRVYELTELLVEHRRQLGESQPELFAGLDGQPDPRTLTFPVHEGARQYYARDQPGVVERYADVASVVFSVAVASFSGLLGFGRWRGRRRKDRIDVYYVAVLRIRGQIATMTATEREAAIAELHTLETRAFDALIHEHLAADDTFRIFMALLSDTVSDLRSATSPEPLTSRS